MTSDHDIEARLRRYRPRGPAPALRARVVPDRAWASTRWWYAAAAALLTASIGIYRWSDTLTPTTLGMNTDAVAVERLADWIGGTPEDRTRARVLVADFRADQAARAMAPTEATVNEAER